MKGNIIYGNGTLTDENERSLTGIECAIEFPENYLGVIKVTAFTYLKPQKYHLLLERNGDSYEMELLWISSESSDKKENELNKRQRTTFLANDMRETNLRGSVDNVSKVSSRKLNEIIFYLSPYTGIPVNYSVSSTYDGQVKTQFVNKELFKFEVSGLGEVQFDIFFSKQEIDEPFKNSITMEYPVCILMLKQPIDMGNVFWDTINQDVVPKIDNLLAIVGFMNNRRVIWYKYETSDAVNVYKFYRHTPKIDVFIRGKNREELIPPEHFSPFLKNAIEKLYNSPYKYRMMTAFRDISWKSTSEINISEDIYLSLFSAMEGLFLIYRRISNKENILGSSQFDKLRSAFLRTIRSLELRNEVEQSIINKLPELNRYSLREVYEQFVRERHLDVEALWPVYTCSGDKPGLSDIRNVLIHGEDADYFNIYIYAQYHLELILQRVICNLLEWPLDKTNIGNDKLKNYIAVANMKDIRDEVKIQYAQIQEKIKNEKKALNHLGAKKS